MYSKYDNILGSIGNNQNGMCDHLIQKIIFTLTTCNFIVSGCMLGLGIPLESRGTQDMVIALVDS